MGLVFFEVLGRVLLGLGEWIFGFCEMILLRGCKYIQLSFIIMPSPSPKTKSFNERRHMWWENFRLLLGEADRQLDYQWAARLKLKDPIPEKKKPEGGGSVSLTSFVDEGDDVLDRYEGVCWYYFNGQGTDGYRWQSMEYIDDSGLPASVMDEMKIRPEGDPKQEMVDNYYLPYATYVWNSMEPESPDVSWWTWVKVRIFLFL